MSIVVEMAHCIFYFRLNLICIINTTKRIILSKTTFGIYTELFPKSFLFFLLTANFFFVVEQCAFFFKRTKEILFSQTPFCNGVILRDCLEENLFFQKNLQTSVQNPFLILKEKTIASSSLEGIKYLKKVLYFQNSQVFDIDKTVVSFI